MPGIPSPPPLQLKTNNKQLMCFGKITQTNTWKVKFLPPSTLEPTKILWWFQKQFEKYIIQALGFEVAIIISSKGKRKPLGSRGKKKKEVNILKHSLTVKVNSEFEWSRLLVELKQQTSVCAWGCMTAYSVPPTDVWPSQEAEARAFKDAEGIGKDSAGPQQPVAQSMRVLISLKP